MICRLISSVFIISALFIIPVEYRFLLDIVCPQGPVQDKGSEKPVLMQVPVVLLQNLLYIGSVKEIGHDMHQKPNSNEQQGRDKERKGKEQGKGLNSVEQEEIVLPAFLGSILESPYVKEY